MGFDLKFQGKKCQLASCPCLLCLLSTRALAGVHGQLGCDEDTRKIVHMARRHRRSWLWCV